MSDETTAFAPFDVLGPLAEGTTVIEASAGTGKTWSLTSLYARLVIEQGIPVERMLALTFGRAAAAELHDRVRARLLEAKSALGAALAGRAPPDGDVVIRALVTGDRRGARPLPAVELSLRHRRAEHALEHLDAAAISTIHGFCLDTARRRAFSLDVSFGLRLVEDDREALGELVDDFLTRSMATSDATTAASLRSVARLRRDELHAVLRALLGRPDATVLPAPAAWDPLDQAFAEDVRAFRAAWRSGGEQAYIEAVSAMHAQGMFKGKTFGRSKSREVFAAFRTRLDAMNAWLEAGAKATDRPAAGKGLGPEDLEAHLLPGHTLPRDPAIDLVATFLERASAAHIDAPRAGFVHFAREELRRRRDHAREVGHDDTLRTLRDGLRRVEGAAVAARIRDAYDVALIDEFQDTDPVQWDIFRRLFHAAPGKRLFLVGDPKQAIYAFRGADVQVYAEACRDTPAERRVTLTESYRSDGALVHALDTTYRDRGAVFEEDLPRYVPMRAARDRHGWTALRGTDRAPAPAALRVRWFDAATWRGANEAFAIAKGEATERVPDLVAGDIAARLASGLRLADARGRERPVSANDIAVLVRTNGQAAAVQRALLAHGINAVIAAQGDVFRSREAGWLAAYLATLADPNETSARSFALSPLGGFSVDGLHRATHVGADDSGTHEDATRWLALLDALADQRRACAERGIAVALRGCLDRDPTLLPRLARSPGGERCLTNLRHLEELLHARELATGRSVSALASWFVRRQSEDDVTEGEAELRLEADRDAVRVTTMHKSKGLEYPVVYLPFAWDGSLGRPRDVARVFHERDARGQLTRELVVDTRRGDGRPFAPRNAAWAREETLAENLRLFYVALTRARHHVVVYAGAVTAQGGTGGLATSPVGVLLHGGREPACAPRTRAARAAVDIEARLAQRDRAAFRGIVAELDQLAAATRPSDAPAGSCVDWDEGDAVEPENAPRAPNAPAPGALRRRPITRGLAIARPTGYLRASYTSLTARAGHGSTAPSLSPANEPAGDLPEAGFPDAVASGVEAIDEDDVPLARFARGAAVGVYVHELFERLDFRTGREREDRRARAPAALGKGRDRETFAREEARVHGVDAADAERLAAALPGILQAPLGRDAGGGRLADLGTDDRLDELSFDLAVSGGHAYEPGHSSTGASSPRSVSAVALGAALTTPRIAGAPDEGLPWPRAYTEALRRGDLGFPDFGGFLTGSLDLVYRVATDRGFRYFVADYKTNWLGRPDQTGDLRSTAAAYRRDGLVGEMVKHHYFVQAHLYVLALHRFLGARLGARYDYDAHIGGAVYLFVRGMGAEPGAGILVDRPPLAVIAALDALFGGSTPRPGTP